MKRFLEIFLFVLIPYYAFAQNFPLDGRVRLDLPIKTKNFMECFFNTHDILPKGMRLLSKNAKIENDKVAMFRLQFESSEHLNVDSARTLLLSILDEFLQAINTNKNLRPYLGTYPFTANQIDLRVRFSFPYCDRQAYPFIGNISELGAYDGRLVYYTVNSYNRKLEVYRAETIGEALFIQRSRHG